MRVTVGVFLGIMLSGAAWADQLSLEQLKAQCVAWEQNGQIKPFVTELACSHTKTIWKKSVKNETKLSNEKEYSAEFSMKDGRYKTAVIAQPVVVSDQTGDCPVYEQFKVTVEGPLKQIRSCQELLAVEDFGALCFKTIQEQCAADPQLCTQEEESTKVVVSTCSTPNGGQGKQNQGGKR